MNPPTGPQVHPKVEAAEEIKIIVPLYTVPFGGAVEGVDYIPVEAPTAFRCDITSEYGWRIHPVTKIRKFHKGIDLNLPRPTEMFTRNRAQVITADFKDDGGGRRVVLLHFNKWTHRTYSFYTAYFHLSEILVKPGDVVEAGTVVALSGGDPTDKMSGLTTGFHGHFETRKVDGYEPVRPIIYWPKPKDV